MAFNASPQYPGSYLGVRAVHPPNILEHNFIPGPNNWQNVVVGDIWIYEPTPTSSAGRRVYMLVSLVGNQALWVEFTTNVGTMISLTGNTGTNPVFPDGLGNINILGDGTSINVTGNSGTNTLTINAITNGTSIVSTLTGNSGGAVSPTAGNINIRGDGTTINVVGNPGTSTLTISTVAGSGVIDVINGDSGSITGPVVTIFANNATNNSGSSVNFVNSGTVSTFNVTDANSNTMIGKLAGNLTITSPSNVGIGNNALAALTSGGGSNTAVGVSAGGALTTGTSNVCVGASALGGGITTGSDNIAVGLNALHGFSGATISRNIGIGSSAGTAYISAESDNIVIGYQNGGTGGESNALRIGTGTGTAPGQINKAFISGIYGITTTSSTTSAVLVSNGNQLGTVSSSRRFKNTIKDMGDSSSAILHCRPVTFFYNKHTDNVKQYGLIAEEVNEIFPDLVNLDDEGKPFSVKYHDLPILLLAEIQKLHKRITELESK